MTPHFPTQCHLCSVDAVAVFYFSHGCYCNDTTVQPLCLHHVYTSGPAVSGGSMEMIKDLTVGDAFSRNWFDGKTLAARASQLERVDGKTDQTTGER